MCWAKETGEVVIITDVSAATLGRSERQQRSMAWTVGILSWEGDRWWAFLNTVMNLLLA